MYEYRAIIVGVVDGDTVDIDVDLGFNVWLHDQRVRLYGIDAPESRTSDPQEKVFGFLAKDRVCELLPVGSECLISTHKDRGKYGRLLADFRLQATTICDTLVEERLAVRYHGQAKSSIKGEHLANREYHYLKNPSLRLKGKGE